MWRFELLTPGGEGIADRSPEKMELVGGWSVELSKAREREKAVITLFSQGVAQLSECTLLSKTVKAFLSNGGMK